MKSRQGVQMKKGLKKGMKRILKLHAFHFPNGDEYNPRNF
jgi:hypothetical protein